MCLIAVPSELALKARDAESNLNIESITLELLTACSGQPERPFWVCTEIRRAKLTVGDEMRSKRKFTVLIEKDEAGYYVASVPALRGCHTQAKNLDILMKRVREVIELCLEASGGKAGSPELVGIQQITV